MICFKGIALISVLIFLLIFSMLSLFMLESSQISNRLSNNFWLAQDISIISENILVQAEKNFSNCIIPMTPTKKLLTLPLSWWQTSSCQGNFQLFEYYYIAESLGEDPCALINTPNNKNLTANFYRVTLLVLTKNKIQQKFLQSTIVVPMESSSQCDAIKHSIRSGRIMWRNMI